MGLSWSVDTLHDYYIIYCFFSVSPSKLQNV